MKKKSSGTGPNSSSGESCLNAEVRSRSGTERSNRGAGPNSREKSRRSTARED